MKRVMILSLALCLLAGMCLPANAAVNEPDHPQASNYFASYGCVIGDNGGHVLHITFTAHGVGVCDEIGVANYQVEKYVELTNGSHGWMNVSGVLPGQTRTNAMYCTYGVNFQGVAGERYRVRATFMCTKTINGVVGTELKSVITTSVVVN